MSVFIDTSAFIALLDADYVIFLMLPRSSRSSYSATLYPRKNFENDARHIAVATVYTVDMIVSWNFRHIVHYDRIRQFNSVNLREGYKVIEIYSPREVVSDEI